MLQMDSSYNIILNWEDPKFMRPMLLSLGSEEYCIWSFPNFAGNVNISSLLAHNIATKLLQRNRFINFVAMLWQRCVFGGYKFNDTVL